MEKLKRALEICAEIEKLQAELREVLSKQNEDKEAEPQTEAPCCNIEEVSTAITQTQCNDLRKIFTINDRFRFRRELFGGDDSAFMSAVDTLSAMSSLKEADEYLSSMPWDHDSEAVAEFMTLISNFFNRR